jgi:hypothetical protein
MVRIVCAAAAAVLVVAGCHGPTSATVPRPVPNPPPTAPTAPAGW